MSEHTQTTMERLYEQIETGDDNFAVRLYSEGQRMEWKMDSAKQTLRRYAESVQRQAADSIAWLDGERGPYISTLGNYSDSYDEAVTEIKSLNEQMSAWDSLAAAYLDR